jgi:hypothetical protein
MRSKLSTFVLASAALAAVALTTIPAVAATSTTLKVPFSFTVDGQSLPAGEYAVARDDGGNFVSLRSKVTSQSFTWVASPTATNNERVILKFDGQSQEHALQSIQYGPLVTAKLSKKSKKTEDVSPQFTPGQ